MKSIKSKKVVAQTTSRKAVKSKEASKPKKSVKDHPSQKNAQIEEKSPISINIETPTVKKPIRLQTAEGWKRSMTHKRK